jgi:hypothetical protein
MASLIAFLVYGESDSGRNALLEEKYRDLAAAFQDADYFVESVLYHHSTAAEVARKLVEFNAVLVWINPIEPGLDREKLDSVLREVAARAVFVSAHPDVILKIGTKDILYKTRDMGWSAHVDLYTSPNDFASRFPNSLLKAGVRILKQYRGNGGNGVFRVVVDQSSGMVTVVHAMGYQSRRYSRDEFLHEFSSLFADGGMLIEQALNTNMANGMVRCYMSGTHVAGFGYQEVNALYQTVDGDFVRPGKRYYHTENCGLFSDLRHIMEKEWIPELQRSQSLSDSELPVIWDADFFINAPNSSDTANKYSLCEINVSCVSPFPPSAIPFIVENVKTRIMNRKSK